MSSVATNEMDGPNESYVFDAEEEKLGEKLFQTVRDLVVRAPDDVLLELMRSCPESFAWFMDGSYRHARPSKPTMQREIQTILNCLLDKCAL